MVSKHQSINEIRKTGTTESGRPKIATTQENQEYVGKLLLKKNILEHTNPNEKSRRNRMWVGGQ